jgi:hypothetical protein
LEILHDVYVEMDDFLVLSNGMDYFGKEILEFHVQLLELVVISHVFEQLSQQLQIFERVHGGMSFLNQNQNQLLDERFEKRVIVVLVQQFHGDLDQPEKENLEVVFVFVVGAAGFQMVRSLFQFLQKELYQDFGQVLPTRHHLLVLLGHDLLARVLKVERVYYEVLQADFETVSRVF